MAPQHLLVGKVYIRSSIAQFKVMAPQHRTIAPTPKSPGEARFITWDLSNSVGSFHVITLLTWDLSNSVGSFHFITFLTCDLSNHGLLQFHYITGTAKFVGG